MSTPEINQVLAQMRVMSAQASSGPVDVETPRSDFSDLLKRSIDAVNETQQKAGDLDYRAHFETVTPVGAYKARYTAEFVGADL